MAAEKANVFEVDKGNASWPPEVVCNRPIFDLVVVAVLSEC